jgi:hypothetical protein
MKSHTERQSAAPFAFAKRTIRSENVYLVKGCDSTGRAAWYYVLVSPLKMRLFEHQSKSGSMNLNDFGVILRSGYGENPPEDAVQQAREEFGFEAG